MAMKMGWQQFENNGQNNQNYIQLPFLKLDEGSYNLRLLCMPGSYYNYTLTKDGGFIYKKALEYSSALKEKYGDSLKIQKKGMVCVLNVDKLKAGAKCIEIVDAPYASVFSQFAQYLSAKNEDPADPVVGPKWNISIKGKRLNKKYHLMPLEPFPLINLKNEKLGKTIAVKLIEAFVDEDLDSEKAKKAKSVFMKNQEAFFAKIVEKAVDVIQNMPIVDNSEDDTVLENALLELDKKQDTDAKSEQDSQETTSDDSFGNVDNDSTDDSNNSFVDEDSDDVAF